MGFPKRLAVPENLGCVALLACQNKRERKNGYVVGDGVRDGTEFEKFEKVAILMVWGSRCESWVYRGKNK